MIVQADERETHFNLVANNRKEVEVFSDDPLMINKLKIKYTPYEIIGDGWWFKIPTKDILRINFLTNVKEKK